MTHQLMSSIFYEKLRKKYASDIIEIESTKENFEFSD